MMIEELRALALSVIEPNLDIDSLIDRIQHYSESFEVWYGEHRAELEAFENSTEIRELLDLHNQVLGFAETALKGTSNEIIKLKLKGKGLLAYTDILPRRISITRTRKG